MSQTPITLEWQDFQETTPGIQEFHEWQAEVADGSGEDVTWDFGDMGSNSTITITYLLPDDLPHPEAFPTASYATEDGSGGYLVFELTNDGLFEWGYDNVVAAGVYDDPVQRMAFPFDYNDTFTDEFSGVFSIGDTDIERSGTISVSYTGYGDIIMPSGLVENVAKVEVEENIEEDTPWGLVQIQNIHAIWKQANSGRSLMDVWFENYDGIVTEGTNYREADEVSVGERTNTELVAYPNPAREFVFVHGGFSSKANFAVYDLYGRLLMHGLLKGQGIDNSSEINIDALPMGQYLLRINDQGKTYQSKLLVAN